MDDVELAPFDNLLVYKNNYTAAFVQETISKKGLNGLRIFTDLGEKPKNLDFLAEYSFLEYLSIDTGVDYDMEFLLNLPQLKKLSLGVWGNKRIDLSYQTNLESLSLDWRKNILGLEKCINLKKISLANCKEGDLGRLTGLINLKELIIKTSSIKTLNSITELRKLEHILLGNCRYLTSIEGINGLPNLKHLELWSCTKIMDYDSLTDLPSLEEITMTDCNKVASIKFIKNFPSLKKLFLTGNTNIVDGDMLTVNELALNDVIISPRRHYNIRIGERRSRAQR